jgi:hypothetical protein
VGDANEGDKTYCDVPNPSNPCHDRNSDTTGLYTCIDGSHEEDWRDFKGGRAEEEENETEGELTEQKGTKLRQEKDYLKKVDVKKRMTIVAQTKDAGVKV